MPQLIQHIPIERDGVPTPQTLAPILKAAQPGTVTLVGAPGYDDSALAQTLLSLSLELAKTRKTVFASVTYQRKSLQRRLAAAALGVSPYDVHSFANENPQRIAEALDAVSKTSLSIYTPCSPDDYNDSLFPSGGACVIGVAQALVPDFAKLDTDPAEWMSENATAHNVAVIAGLYLSARPDDPNAPIAGLQRRDRPFFDNADAVFALHDERRRGGDNVNSDSIMELLAKHALMIKEAQNNAKTAHHLAVMALMIAVALLLFVLALCGAFS